MGVMLSRDAEKIRTAHNRKNRQYEYLITTSMVEALHFARDHGWEHRKVQVRATPTMDDMYEYSVEPFDDCKCPNLLRFSDYFDEGSVSSDQE